MTMPAPESGSGPAAPMSTAVAVNNVRICAAVNAGLADLSRPAIAAACGAAADVPKNDDGNPPTPVTLTPSAAVMSGFCRSTPPVEERFPAVYGEPSAAKNTRRGPSELKVSTTLVALNGCGNGPTAGVAATSNAAAAAAWPWVSPAVAIERTPRLVPRCRNRIAAVFFLTITIRSPLVPGLFNCSYGSCVPL